MSMLPPIGAILLMCAAAATARDIDLGTIELAGSGNITTYTDDEYSSSRLYLRPEAAFYLSPWVHIGPVFGYTLTSSEYDSFEGESSESTTSSLSAGAKAGCLINYSQALGRPLPFFAFAYSREFDSFKYAGTSAEKQRGHAFAISGGIKLKISESFLLHLFHEFSHQNVTVSLNQFSWGFGFSGIL